MMTFRFPAKVVDVRLANFIVMNLDLGFGIHTDKLVCVFPDIELPAVCSPESKELRKKVEELLRDSIIQPLAVESKMFIGNEIHGDILIGVNYENWIHLDRLSDWLRFRPNRKKE